MNKLKNCPFCGGEPEMIHAVLEEYHSVEPEIFCEKCRYTIKLKELAIAIDESPETNADWWDRGITKKWNTRPAEDEKNKEIEKVKSDLGIQKNLTRQAVFEANRAYDEVEKLKKMFYDLIDKQSSVSTDPKVIVVSTDTNVLANAPDMNDGRMEGK